MSDETDYVMTASELHQAAGEINADALLLLRASEVLTEAAERLRVAISKWNKALAVMDDALKVGRS